MLRLPQSLLRPLLRSPLLLPLPHLQELSNRQLLHRRPTTRRTRSATTQSSSACPRLKRCHCPRARLAVPRPSKPPISLCRTPPLERPGQLQELPPPEAAAAGAAAIAAATAAAASNKPQGSSTPTGGASENVHRVQLDFKPSMEDELEIKSGETVRLVHEYDDGWVSKPTSMSSTLTSPRLSA
jgi:hypothetical protein